MSNRHRFFLVLIILITLIPACTGKKPYCYLSVSIEGRGTVHPVSNFYAEGTKVEFKIIPAADWFFSHWEGLNSSEIIKDNNVWKLLIDRNKNITAVFSQGTCSLSIKILGEGKVEERLIKDETASEHPFKSILELTARPKPNWVFKEWLGDVRSAEKSIHLHLDGHKEIVAVFLESGTNMALLSGEIILEHMWPNFYQKPKKTNINDYKGQKKLPLIDYMEKIGKLSPRELIVPGELFLVFKPGILMAKEEISLLEAQGYKILKSFEFLHTYLIQVDRLVDESAIFQVKEKLLEEIPELAYLEPNYLYYACGQDAFLEPNDSLYPYQWHYPLICLPQAWKATRGSKAIRIGILDTGVDTRHPDLGENIDLNSAWNFVDNNSDCTDKNGHGSHCAGTIAADSNNILGVTGVMWEASLIPVKVLNDAGIGKTSDIIEGMLYAAGLGAKNLSNPAQVLSLSLGGAMYSSVFEEVCRRIAEAGVIIVAASGNYDGPVLYPAFFDSVICVGATDYNYPRSPKKAPYSNFGPQLDLVAPGGDTQRDSDNDRYGDGVLSTGFIELSDYNYPFYQGTSMATPHVAGLIGLMLAKGIPSHEVDSILRRTAFDLGNPGFDHYYGHGLVNAYWAVNNVQTIKLLVGNWVEDRIEAVVEKEFDLKSNYYGFGNIPPGQYKVFAWIDVENTGKIEVGDYFYESEIIDFSVGNHSLNLILKEIIN